MPSWNELVQEVDSLPNDAAREQWLRNGIQGALQQISDLRGGRNVIFYASSFLQKPTIPPWLAMLTAEEINGLMSVMYGMTWADNLTLLLHTPGGVTNAAETVVAYLRSKFSDIEVVVPTLAMSAGTMIALSANRVIMGRQSQLGPIDPQIPLPRDGRSVSARAIVEQFEAAREDIVGEGGDIGRAHVWAAVLQSLGPALLQEAKNALDYGEKMVAAWLRCWMFAGRTEAEATGSRVASYFNDAAIHKSHGRRIDRNEARAVGVEVEDLEDDQALQEAVLTAYHMVTIAFEKTPVAKVLWTNQGRAWVKNVPMLVQMPQQLPRA